MKKSKGFFKVTIYTNANEFGYGKVFADRKKAKQYYDQFKVGYIWDSWTNEYEYEGEDGHIYVDFEDVTEKVTKVVFEEID